MRAKLEINPWLLLNSGEIEISKAIPPRFDTEKGRQRQREKEASSRDI
jgi:hypothetical protein